MTQPDSSIAAPGRSTRREHLRRVGLAALVAGVGSAIQACAAGGLLSKQAPPTADSLLLAPADFPDAHLREKQRLGQRETRDGGQTAQVILENDRLRMFQSVVVFPSADVARAALQSMRSGGAGERWEVIRSAPSFGEESLVLVGKHGSRDAASAVFRQGEILVRVTLTGTAKVAELSRYARKAETKVK